MNVLSKDSVAFPPADCADENGIVAVGGDLSASRLYEAYRAGIFPWPHDGLPLLWFCPDPRFVLEPHNIVVARSLKKAIKKTPLTITADTNFLAVIRACQASNRNHQSGTWITDEMVAGYQELFNLGIAHSIEAYDGPELVGGLYGVSLGRIFYGESMFFEQRDASKIALVTLAAQLKLWQFSLIDCQAHTNHMESLGAHPIPRADFLGRIGQNKSLPTKKGPWSLTISPQEALIILA